MHTISSCSKLEDVKNSSRSYQRISRFSLLIEDVVDLSQGRPISLGGSETENGYEREGESIDGWKGQQIEDD